MTSSVLYKLGSALYRPVAGAFAAAAFVVLPITLSFASFNALEVPLIAFGTLFLWRWVEARQKGSLRNYLAMIGAGALLVNTDWPGFILVFTVLGIELFAGGATHWASRKRLADPRIRQIHRRWILALTSLLAVVALIGFAYMLIFKHLGKWEDLWASYDLRARGRDVPLWQKLAYRRFWNQLMFTPLAILLGKAGLFVVVLRVLVRREAREAAPLAALLMAVFQYVAFPNGADVHIFWPHTFALYFALFMGALVATTLPALSALTERSKLSRILAGW